MYKMHLDSLECVSVVKIQNDLDKEVETELKDQGIESQGVHNQEIRERHQYLQDLLSVYRITGKNHILLYGVPMGSFRCSHFAFRAKMREQKCKGSKVQRCDA